jgi:glutaredoxin
MKTVKVLGLRNCSWCNTLKGELQYNNIPYSFIDVDKQSRIADFVEELLETDHYPIALVEDSGSVCYIHRSFDYDTYGKKKLDDRVTKIGVFEIEDMVREIKILINYKNEI